jgi:biopolymer transport protein ExbB
MQPDKLGLDRVPCALGAALVGFILLGGVVHAQAPQQGTLAPAASAPVSAASPGVAAPVAGALTPPVASPGAAAPVATAAPAEGTPAQPQEAAAAPPAADTAAGLLPRDLTPWGMFMSADIVVKAVMIGLIFASVLTWTIWLAKTLELIGARRSLARAQGVLAEARSLAEAAKPAGVACRPVARLIAAVESELRRSPDRRDIDGIKERIAARFERIEAGVGRQMLRGTGILATIGATAPFVGLFGTVWGIMNSFIGISKLHTTNLAVVAPGIAEALLATAFGLAAAIPAVVIYNMFSRSIAQYRALYADTSVEILTMVSRDLVQRYPAAAPAAE